MAHVHLHQPLCLYCGFVNFAERGEWHNMGDQDIANALRICTLCIFLYGLLLMLCLLLLSFNAHMVGKPFPSCIEYRSPA